MNDPRSSVRLLQGDCDSGGAPHGDLNVIPGFYGSVMTSSLRLKQITLDTDADAYGEVVGEQFLD
jgi:hypothetical protein